MLFYYLITLFLSNNLEAKTYTLNDLMNHIQKHPDVLENEFEISKAENQINKIKGEIGPKFSAIVGMGPNYSTTGNALSSVQSKSLNTKSYLAELDLKIPIFTFFRDRDYKNAAAINIEVKKIEKEQKIRELQRKAKEIYYSLQYAQTLNDYATDTQKDLESVLSDFAKSKKNNSEEHNKLKIFYNVVMAKKLEIEKGIKLSKLGIQYITNDFDQAIELDQSWLAFSEVTLPKLEDLILKIKEEHLDYKKVELGIKAYESLNSGEEKAKLPTFGIFAKYDWMNTDKSTIQNSKFANDPYNKKDASLGIGLIWDFDFGSKDYKINEAKIELNNLLTKKNFADKGLPLKVSKVYFEVEEALGKVKEYESAYKQSKKLMNRLGSEVALGLTPAKDIIDVYTTKAEMYKNYLESIYQYNLKVAELETELKL